MLTGSALTEHQKEFPDYDPEFEQSYVDEISVHLINDMVVDREDCVAADGCRVDIDGHCPHGYRSPLVVLGII